MNGYELTSRMRRTRRRYPLTATEQALYHELVAICNEDEWADTFSCSNQELCNALQITEKTLTVARLALIQAGLLFYKSGQSKRQFGTYSFLQPLEKKQTTVKITVDATTNTTTDNGGDATANTTTNPTANASDYIKTKTERKGKTNSKDAGAHTPVVKKFKDLTEKEFYDELATFVATYPKEMIRAFYDYWREKSPSGKMKFQLEKTWEVNLRLEKWKNNQEKFNANGHGKTNWQNSSHRPVVTGTATGSGKL